MYLKKIISLSIILLIFFLHTGGAVMAFEIVSPAFKQNEVIPKKYTCEGEDISPELEWRDFPEGTKSFALINDDPDAPMGTWVHWVIFNIPATVNELSENVKKSPRLENGAIQGMTDFGRVGYGGPCPPPGKYHRYFFKLYALDMMINLDSNATKEDLLQAMEGHIIDKAELAGRFKR